MPELFELYWGYYIPIMVNQMEKKMENEMETGIIRYFPLHGGVGTSAEAGMNTRLFQSELQRMIQDLRHIARTV